MALKRREFLKLMGGTAAVFTFPGALWHGSKKILEKAAERTPVIWLQGQSCSGCSISLLNGADPDFVTLITKHISLDFHQTVMTGTGDVAVGILQQAVEKKIKDYILVAEGAIPTKADEFCSIGEMEGKSVAVRKWVEELGQNAKAVVAVGTCASYGGIPAAKIRATGDNPTGARGMESILPQAKIINVPGCPPHPDWIMGTIFYYLLKGLPELDEYKRPVLYYGRTVHEQCEHLKDYKKGKYAKAWGQDGCLYLLGCLGMDTGCDIPKRKWVDGTESCTGCGSGCIGCTEAVFPDYGNRGLYKHLTASLEDIQGIEDPQIRSAVLALKNGGIIHG